MSLVSFCIHSAAHHVPSDSIHPSSLGVPFLQVPLLSFLGSSTAVHFLKFSLRDQLSYSFSSGTSNTSVPTFTFALPVSMRIFSIFDFLLDLLRKSTLIMTMMIKIITIIIIISYSWQLISFRLAVYILMRKAITPKIFLLIF